MPTHVIALIKLTITNCKSPNIYNYRSTTHTCTNCKINGPECCSNRGDVVPLEEHPEGAKFLPKDVTRAFVCECEDGFDGVACENAHAPAHEEL